LRTRCLIVLLLYILMIISAGAIKNQETEVANFLNILAEADPASESIQIAPDPSGGAWDKLIPTNEENYSTILFSSMDPNQFNPDLVLERDLSIGNIKTQRDYIIETDLNGLIKTDDVDKTQYLSRYYDEIITNINRPIIDQPIIDQPIIDQPIYENKSAISRANSDFRYIYEKDLDLNKQKIKDVMEGENQIYLSYLDQNSLKRPDEVSEVTHLAIAADSYLPLETQSLQNQRRSPLFTDQNKANNDLYKELSTFETGKEKAKKQASSSDAIQENNNIIIQNPIYDHLSDLNLIEKTSTPSAQSAEGLMDTADATESLNILIRDYQRTPSGSNTTSQTDLGRIYFPEKLPSPGHRENSRQNYAVVVGIDEYSDRMGLHTCDNDAKSVADLLNSLGYKVILLSDNAGTKPTKHNILNVALRDANLKKSKGNIIFYFSGHGEKDSNGNFYLIPQDANGNHTSYISDSELKQSLKDLKNLAVIVDACNGGGFSNAIGEGQLIMASSKDNEPSNEEWTGSFSIFTQNLCHAIREQGCKGDKIPLQECFQEAYNDTVRWSRVHLTKQNPILVDLTHKAYNLR
jgi:hypothetical protein